MTVVLVVVVWLALVLLVGRVAGSVALARLRGDRPGVGAGRTPAPTVGRGQRLPSR
jgi:hypothetical protein